VVSKRNYITKIYFLIVVSCLLCIACSNLHTEKKHNPIAGKWSIKAIKTKDSLLLPPGLTTYSFDMDSTYTVALHKTEEIIYIYKGIYRLNSEKNILETDYNIDGPQHDEAKILLLEKSEMQIVDFKTKDTLFFSAYRK
jgi:hypothetical protein